MSFFLMIASRYLRFSVCLCSTLRWIVFEAKISAKCLIGWTIYMYKWVWMTATNRINNYFRERSSFGWNNIEYWISTSYNEYWENQRIDWDTQTIFEMFILFGIASDFYLWNKYARWYPFALDTHVSIIHQFCFVLIYYYEFRATIISMRMSEITMWESVCIVKIFFFQRNSVSNY